MSERMRQAAGRAALAGVFIAFAGSVAAQNLPGGATPGGNLPRIEQERRLAPAPAVVIPPVLERPELDDESSGQRIAVREFRLVANRDADTAWQYGRYLAGVEAELARALAAQPPEGFTLGQLERLTRGIQSDLRAQGLVLAQVFLPVQQVVDGVLAIEIIEGRLGRVVVEGNQRYGEPRLRKPVEDLVDRAVDNGDVERGLLLLRDYPGLTVAGVFSPGEERGETDLTLRVQNEKRFDVSLSADNYGTEFTGEYRVVASADWYNPTGAADLLSVAVLQTLNPADGLYGSLSYTRPMFTPATTLGVSFLQNDFDISSQLLAGLNEQLLEGETTIGSLFATHAFKRSRNANLTGRVALDLKRAVIDDVTDSGNPFQAAEDKLTVVDLSLAFDFVDTRFRGVNRGYVAYAHGFPDLFGSLDEQSNTLGSSRRNGSGEFAGGRFDRWHGAFSRLQSLTENSDLFIRLEAQHSDDLIVSLEQLGLGGPNSVRAYPPSEFLVDTGGFASLEWIVSAPGFADADAFDGYRWGDLLRFSVFYDYAGGYLSEPSFGEEKTTDLHGYGIGVDFRWPGRIWARLDVATPASDFDASDGDDPQVYVRFNYTF